MLDLEFCLEPFNSSLTDDSFEDNLFSLDFSDAEVIISPPSSEDEEEEDDEKEIAEDSQSLSHTEEDADTVMIQPSDSKILAESVDSNSEIPAAVVPTLGTQDIVQNIDDNDEPLPLEFDMASSSHLIPTTSSRLDWSTSAENDEEINKLSSLADARKKLDECMRRTENTRRWISQYVKKTGRNRLANQTKTSKTVTPSAVSSASFSKHNFRLRGQGRGARTPIHKKNTGKSVVQLVHDASVLVREKGSSFESSGVLHRSANLIFDDSSKTGRTTKGSSISDFLRRNRKSASMMIY